MAGQSTLLWNIVKKGVIGGSVGGVLFGASWALGFPLVFQIMFFFYAMLGTAVFILLDAPPMGRIEGIKAVIALLVFYIVLSVAYTGGASLWPQYDPEIEKGKIHKLLSRRKAATEHGKKEELIARAKVLSEKADAIMARLKSAGVGAAPGAAMPGKADGSLKAAAGDLKALEALGLEQWELQECFQCHTIFGKKSKKRGPKLDNIGNLMTKEQLREKIMYPKRWMAEGFEKQYKGKKGRMPDKYRDLMFDEEVDALVAFLATLRDTSVNTPKPISMKKK